MSDLFDALFSGDFLFPLDNIVIFDLEVAPNYLLIKAFRPKDKALFTVELFENKGDLSKIKDFIDEKTILVGYNNFSYDNTFLAYIKYNGYKVSNQDLYDLSQTLIGTKMFETPEPPARFQFKYNQFSRDTKWLKAGKRSIDLIIFNKGKSLKECAVGLNHSLIQDLVFNPDENLSAEVIPTVNKYCENDVVITAKLFVHYKEEIYLRFCLDAKYKEISKKVGFKDSFLSKADPALAKDLMAILYCHAKGLLFKDFRWRIRVPKYKSIKIKDIILPKIAFKTPEFKRVYEQLEGLKLELEAYTIHSKFGDITTYKAPKELDLKIIARLDNRNYTFKLGGLHSDNKHEIYKADENNEIVDIDVASYYPSLIINQRFKPDFLADIWIENYSKLKDERLRLKKSANKVDKIISMAYKIVLNSIYGNFNNVYFYAYDPITAYSITINGQLLILSLIEALVLGGFKVIYANTDGLTLIRPKNKAELFKKIIDEWQAKFKLELEEIIFEFVAYESVNHYFAVKRGEE